MSKREKVLDTAVKMIIENGIQNTSMGKISKNSGVAVGTIYHYFESKEDLITEIYRNLKIKMLERVIENSQPMDDLYDYFKSSIKLLIKYAEENPIEFEFMERHHMSPVIDAKVKEEIENRYKKGVKKIFKMLDEEGLLKEDISLELIIQYFQSSVMGLVRSYINGEIKMTEKEIEQLIQMIWDGITK
ncbi:TetR family transcriptional regulator [Orenia metallireducens]|uniref:Transcriptional regulator, TetR family n=1 Tax=Orenia metallireducens TaxID=1413210 RepID=A0A285GCI4_9FIRM|nr:TetR/AcrR family transcriptional regulator [Orenia metallireducens]PRX19184.1 TetR family transcriptional regulator [Orenia metallireducens]SNY21287.1 transcriptional regulator, TetR family [Orenia metallireducens]